MIVNVLTLYLVLAAFSIYSEAIKFKTLHCEVFDPNYGELKLCELKAINRSNSLINLSYYVKRSLKGITTQVIILKRGNGWHPFLYDFKFNMCHLVEKSQPYLANLLFSYMRPFMNLNRTCPQAHSTIKIENYQFDFEGFRKRFPIEVGEYAVIINFLSGSQRIFSGNASLTYSNYRE